MKQGQTERTDLVYPPELQEKFLVQVSDHSFITSYVSERQLGDGRVFATHYSDDNQANISETNRRGLPYSVVRPFDMGFNMGLDSAIEEALAGPNTLCTYGGEQELQGRRTWVVTCVLTGWTVCFHVDPERGFLPLHAEVTSPDGDFLHAFRLFEVEKCPQDRWLPVHGMITFKSAQPGGVVSVRDVKLIEFNVDQVPPPELLRLDLPPGTRVTDERIRGSYRAKNPTPAYLDLNYRAVVSELVSKEQTNSTVPRSLGHFEYHTLDGSPRSLWHWGRWAFGTLGVLGLAAVLLVLVRRRLTT